MDGEKFYIKQKKSRHSMLNFKKPSASSEYNLVKEKGMKRFLKRYENYQRYLNCLDRKNIDYEPIKMDIEPTSMCNLKCHMCIVSTSGYKGTSLSFDKFKDILDKQIGVFELKIQGLGEPFLNKDFTKMVKYASDLDIWTRSTTNATILHENDNYKEIIDANIGELQISVDGVKKETYEKIRIKSNFEKVSNNCKLINNYQKEKGVQKTRMWTLLQKDNYEDLYKFPKFAKELGFDRLTISIDVNGWGDDEWSKINSEKKVELTQDDIDKLLEISDEIDLDLTFWDISTKYNKSNICEWPFSRGMISADSNVVPCCIISDPKIYTFGNVADFDAIWFDDYKEFRENHIDGKIPEVCKFCYEK